MRIGILTGFLFIHFCLFSLTEAAVAHRLNVYAWLENNNVIVECNFGKDRPAINSVVKIFDTETKKELAHGQTNDKGQYIFRIPESTEDGHGLTIEVLAGEGHRGEWQMEAAELKAAEKLAAGFEAESMTTQSEGNAPLFQADSHPLQGAALTAEHVRGIVNEAMEMHLAPIRQQIAKNSREGITIMEIVGGLGWIAGFVGIALYFRSRQKKNDV